MCEWLENMTAAMIENIDWFNQEYFWKMREGKPVRGARNEQETIKDFNTLSKNLREALKNVNTKKLEGCIGDILKWGGINTPLADDFGTRITRIKELSRSEINQKAISKILNIARSGSNYRISSWSKIFAAIAPGKFFIYDSRVAMALSHFCLENQTQITCFWRIPPYYKSNFQRANRANFEREYNDNKQLEEIPICYFRYHLLLLELSKKTIIQGAYDKLDKNIRNAYEDAGLNKEQAIMAHIEKMLFMMKEKILGQY